jgi:hypothetical protein
MPLGLQLMVDDWNSTQSSPRAEQFRTHVGRAKLAYPA